MAEMNLEECQKVECRYLDKINEQQGKIKMMKKILDQQALKNIEIHERGVHLQQKMRFFISNNKVKAEEMKDMKEEGLLDPETCQVVDMWLELNQDKKFEQVSHQIIHQYS